jgi:hypothetical protein
MDYQKIYNSIINRGLSRASFEGYNEVHHIIPKCLGGSNTEDNLVSLTPEEHYVCHQLLLKLYPNNRKLIYAARMMCVSCPNSKRSNKLYGWIKRRNSAPKRVKKCFVCNTKFSARDSTKKKFCSLKCRDQHTHINKRIKKKCIHCLGEFSVSPSRSEKVYCSEICRQNCKKANRVVYSCYTCNKEMSVVPSQIISKKYCSLNCSGIGRRKT